MGEMRHLIGLLLGTEEDWPRAFELLAERVGPLRAQGETHELPLERIVNEPFSLRAMRIDTPAVALGATTLFARPPRTTPTFSVEGPRRSLLGSAGSRLFIATMASER